MEKYDTSKLSELNIKERDATKIKYIVNKFSNIKNYYSPILEKNPKLKLEIKNSFVEQLQPRMVVFYNNYEEVKIIQKLELTQSSDLDLLIDLENIRKYPYINFKHYKKYGIKIRPNQTIQGIKVQI
jgi:hypothetical protein